MVSQSSVSSLPSFAKRLISRPSNKQHSNYTDLTIPPGGYEPGTSYTWTALDIIPSGTYVFYIQQKSNG